MAKSTELPVVSLKTRNQRLSELVREQLTTWIMDGTLQMGQKISEDEIAEKLGLSRMPIREALRVMEQKGLVQSIPFAGTTIRKLSREEIREIYLLRIELESLACFHAAQNIRPLDILQLEDIQRKMDILASEPLNMETGIQMYQLNKEFHMYMYSIAKMPKLLEFIENLWDNLASVRLNSVCSAGYSSQMQSEHKNYLDALRNRDGKSLADLIKDNLYNHLNKLT